MDKDIDSYLSAMKDIQTSIQQLQGERFIINHKKTLFFSLLETMAKGAYGDVYPNPTTRFEKFIIDFCDWEHYDRISLQQLALLLDGTKEHEFKRLKEFIFHNLEQFPQASAVPFSYDPGINDIKKFLPKGSSIVNGIDIYNLLHVKLLWKNRNSLVHEARPKDSMSMFEFLEYPHYVHFTVMNEGEDNYEVWKISYPVEFFDALVNTALNRVL